LTQPNTFNPLTPKYEQELFLVKPLKSVAAAKTYWSDKFHQSKGVHFFSSFSRGKAVSGDITRDAYSYLVRQHCPVSFRSKATFSNEMIE
jgi:hypothetical protein